MNKPLRLWKGQFLLFLVILWQFLLLYVIRSECYSTILIAKYWNDWEQIGKNKTKKHQTQILSDCESTENLHKILRNEVLTLVCFVYYFLSFSIHCFLLLPVDTSFAMVLDVFMIYYDRIKEKNHKTSMHLIFQKLVTNIL